MKFRLGTLALAAGPVLSLVLIGCNPPIDEAKKGDTAAPTTKTGEPTVTPAPTDTKPADSTPAPTDTKPADSSPAPSPSPAVEPPKVDDKPADATTPAPEVKKDEPPKA